MTSLPNETRQIAVVTGSRYYMDDMGREASRHFRNKKKEYLKDLQSDH
jgi:hypothetical protein